MSRFEREFVADTEARGRDLVNLMDRLAALGEGGVNDSDEGRRQAIVCLLNASDGWREASERLSGAFAAEAVPQQLSRNETKE